MQLRNPDFLHHLRLIQRMVVERLSVMQHIQKAISSPETLRLCRLMHLWVFGIKQTEFEALRVEAGTWNVANGNTKSLKLR